MADGLIKSAAIFTAGLAIGLALFVFGWIGAAAMTVVAYGLRDAI